MISQLTSPSVCVIDEDQEDYQPILDALNGMFISSVHILGNDLTKLPPEPFRGLKLIFVDLHLTAAVGKGAASHTANVFTKIVSPETAPIVVVIWSKYANVPVVGDDALRGDDQETETDLFKRTLLEAQPRYSGRLIFVEMDKPQRDDRPADWTAKLAKSIEATLKDQSAVDVLWKWDSVVRDACVSVSSGLTSLANLSAERTGHGLKDSLKDSMRMLAQAQGGGDFSASMAHRHLAAALAQLLVDHLEHSEQLSSFSSHGNWLRTKPVSAVKDVSTHMNALLLTASVSPNVAPYMPGTVYRAKDVRKFYRTFGKHLSSLADFCCQSKRPSQKWRCWRANVQPVLVELSPECDVAQSYRASAFVVAGLVVPIAFVKELKKAESLSAFPAFHLRQPMPGFVSQDVVLVFCHRYKATLPLSAAPPWLEPWFRFRELPTASLRNLYAGQASRVGYVSL
jgi:hypothetical protein